MAGYSAHSLTLPRSASAPKLPWLLLAALVTIAAAALLAYSFAPAETSANGAVAPAPATSGTRLVAETSSITRGPSGVEAAVAEQSLPLPAVSLSQTSAAVSQAPVAPAAAATAQRWLAEGFVLVTEGQQWDAASYGNVDTALSLIPADVRAKLGNRELGPVHILVNREGRTLAGTQPYGGPANFFSTNDGRNELVLFPGQSVLTILHELGHAYNLRDLPAGRYALVLQDREMRGFMASTGWRVLSSADEVRRARDHTQVEMAYEGPAVWSSVSNHDPLEDFANSFALFFFSPEELRAKSEARWGWFVGALE